MNRHGFRKPRQAPLPRNIYRRSAGRSGNTLAAAAVAPACGIKLLCGACRYVNTDYQAGLDDKYQAGIKVLEAADILNTARVLPPVTSPRPLNYRSLFKLAVRPAPQRAALPRRTATLPDDAAAPPANRFMIGLFAAGTHDVVDMDHCPLHTEALQALIGDLRRELNESAITPYDERLHQGQLRYITARSAHLTGELMLTFVVTEPLKAELRRMVGNLQRRGHKINSAHMNVNAEVGNAIFGPETIRLAGSDRLRERLCDLAFEIGPTAFFQINPWQAINLYRRIESMVGPPAGPGQQVAWDLYCGTGQISLVLARLGYKVLGIEEHAGAVTDATLNARRNHLEDRTTFLASRVEDSTSLVPSWATDPSLIIVNPSRRGLADATRRHIALQLANRPQARLVYVSCDVETLARDLKVINELSGFQVRQIEPFDMFPQTDNMEWLAVLSRP